MFRRSRIRIVLTVMAVLVAFLVATLATVFVSSYLSVSRQNATMLERYVSRYSLDDQPGDNPLLPPPDLTGDAPQLPDGTIYQLSSFYSVALADDGSVLATDAGDGEVYHEEELVSLANETLSTGKASGSLRNLIYRVDQRQGYTLVAFMDTTVTNSSMNALLLNILVVGLVALCVFVPISAALARRIIQPLEENDRRQKQFISDAEHELKTPVSVVGANAELLARQLGDNQWLANIQYENERMGSLIGELLELSHAEDGAAPFETLDFSRLVEREMLPFEGVAFENGLAINADIADRVMVRGNARQLGQLVAILVDNAISHGTGGGEIGLTVRRERRCAVLSVTNPGEEIPASVREHLFDRFYRVDKARGGEEGHFGLGLPIAKAIVEAHRGRIELSCHDETVTMTVTLPAES